jgi:prepilin-type N-terminal cleavage/methylation domain-containing protein
MNRPEKAFTLVEMLVVVAIISLLIAIILPSLGNTREITRRVTCGSNQRQLVSGMVSYAVENPKGWFLPTAEYTDDNISSIIPKYADRSIAICPSTQHKATNLTASYGLPGPSNYHSYEIFSWIGKGSYPDGRVYSTFVLITRKTNKPSKMWVPMDDSSGGNNNWPDAENNHGVDGLNLGYIDGHAGFHNRAEYVRSAIESYHPWFGNDSTTLALAKSAVPNVNNVGGWHGTWSYLP